MKFTKNCKLSFKSETYDKNSESKYGQHKNDNRGTGTYSLHEMKLNITKCMINDHIISTIDYVHASLSSL